MEKIIEKKLNINQKDIFDADSLASILSQFVDINKPLYQTLIESGDIVEDENGNIIKNNFV